MSGVLIESSLKQQLINDVEDYPGSLPYHGIVYVGLVV